MLMNPVHSGHSNHPSHLGRTIDMRGFSFACGALLFASLLLTAYSCLLDFGPFQSLSSNYQVARYSSGLSAFRSGQPIDRSIFELDNGENAQSLSTNSKKPWNSPLSHLADAPSSEKLVPSKQQSPVDIGSDHSSSVEPSEGRSEAGRTSEGRSKAGSTSEERPIQNGGILNLQNVPILNKGTSVSRSFADEITKSTSFSRVSAIPPGLASSPSAVPSSSNKSLSESPYEGCSDVRKAPNHNQCQLSRKICRRMSGAAMLDYMVIHYCWLGGNRKLTVPLYALGLILLFYLLADTAESFFCPTVTALSDMLGLTPNTAGVTLLALGNGAPDLCGSIASFGDGDSRIAMGAILSAGAFVTSVVMGTVAIFVAPFEVEGAGFVRDAAMYAGAVAIVLCFYVERELHLWQAVSLVVYYLAFVLLVVIDQRKHPRHTTSGPSAPLPSASLTDDTERPSDNPMETTTMASNPRHTTSGVPIYSTTRHTTRIPTTSSRSSDDMKGLDERTERGECIISFSRPEARLLTADKGQCMDTDDMLSSLLESNTTHVSVASHARDEASKSEVTGRKCQQRHERKASLLCNLLEPSDSNENPSKGSLAPSGLPFEATRSSSMFSKIHRPLGVLRRAMAAVVFGVRTSLSWVRAAVHFIFDPLRWATVPAGNHPEQWDSVYKAANIILCPAVFLWGANSTFKLNLQQTFIPLPGLPVKVPLWLSLYAITVVAAFFSRLFCKPNIPQIIIVAVSFLMSMTWIGVFARELLGLLTSTGAILGASEALLGVTVLAWGNSIGDLVTDVTLALSGQPMMAVAGCFAGPLFNLMLGLGIPLIIKTASLYPATWSFHEDPHLSLLFPFLLTSVLGSIFVIPYSKYHLTRTWGCFLVGLYVVVVAASVCMEIGYRH